MLEVVFDAEKCGNHNDPNLAGSFHRPLNENHRLKILRQCDLVGSTIFSEVFDRYVALCSRYFKVRLFCQPSSTNLSFKLPCLGSNLDYCIDRV